MIPFLHNKVRWSPLLSFCSVALASATSAGAQGFGLNEIGSCAIGRGFAVTGAVCNDASVIFWNPAAAAELTGGTMLLGGALIHVNGGFRQDTTLRRYAANVPTSQVPNLFLNSVRDKVAYGIGVYAPYGLTSQWNGDFPGRFEALKSSIKTIYFQPNIAYALSPDWSVGGGVIFGHSNVELIQALDLSAQLAQPGGPTFGQLGITTGTQFATARVTGSANGFGYNVGVHGKLGSVLSIGGRYLSSVRFSYDDAKARFTQVSTGLILSADNPLTGVATPVDVLVQGQFSGSGALTPQTASTVIKHPWQAQGGIGFTGLPNTTLSGDVARIGWSAFKTLPLTFSGNAAGSNRVLLEDYHDIWLYRFGAEHTIKTGSMEGVILRAGYSYAQSPAPDETVTPLLPDMARQNGSFGVGVPFGENAMLDFSYLHVATPGRRGRITERTSAAQTAAQLNSGSYDLNANIFSLSLITHF